MGITKLSWDECKGMIQVANQKLYELLDEYPGIRNYTFEKYSYKYGQIVCDEHNFYTPDGIPVLDNIPFSLFLNKNFEMFLNFENKRISETILRKGDLIFIASFLNKEYLRHAFADISLCAGSRSPIIVGNIGNSTKYHELSKYLNHNIVKYCANDDNFYLLKEMCNGYQSKWRAEFLSFSIKLHKKILQRDNIHSLKIIDYVNNYFLGRESYAISSKYYQLILSYVKRFYSNMKNSTYINDIIRDICNIVCEYKSSYILAHNDDSIPLSDIHYMFNEIYKTKIAPFIMVPSVFSALDEHNHYFSLPIHTITYKPDKIINLADFAVQVKNLFEIYKESISNLKLSKGTLFYDASQSLNLEIITDRVSEASKQNHVTMMKDITTIDFNFNKQLMNFNNKGYKVEVPQRSTFFSAAFLLDYQKSF